MAQTELLLLHGALGASEQFQPWMPLLSPHFSLHILDFEGHGAMPFADRPFEIDHFVQNVLDYLDANGLEKVDIFGYSMGGYVALRLSLLHPERVGKIFTFATKLAWTPESAAKETKMLEPESILAKVPKFAEMLAARHHGNDWKGHLQRTAEMMLALGKAPLLQTAEFSAITHTVRMGLGDRDTMVSLDETANAYRQLPNASLIVLPNTPHPIEKTNSHRMCAEIKEFFLG
jgi:pimeloyl-ACP methyl ester carboxylesterase